MLTLENAQQLIAHEFEKLSLYKDPVELYEPIHYILSIGGKRIRPSMVLLSCSLFSDDFTVAIKPALGLEIFHNFTLLHDDIMDNANLRRNRDTVHVKWNTNTAILSGDAMSIKAYQFMCASPKEVIHEVIEVFNQTALEVCEGQQYDMNFETRSNVTVNEYLHMIELKTSVLLAASLKIGAILGGASPANANLLYEFGRNLGLAFQLQDDLLDVFGNEALFGKEIGKDIVSNKKTYLLIKAFELAQGNDLATLNDWTTRAEFNRDEKIKIVTDLYLKLGVKQQCEALIDSYFDKARQQLNEVSASAESKNELHLFMNSLKERNY